MWLASAAVFAAEPALADVSRIIAAANAAEQQNPVLFAIPPQSLSSAIVAFSRVADLDVVFDGPIADGATTRGVSGSLRPAQALQRLLEGTGLRATLTDHRTITLLRTQAGGPTDAVELREINVEGRTTGESAFGPVDGFVATRSATGSKTDAPLVEIPQTINVVTADQIKAQGAQTVGEALRYTPGVRAEGYGAASPFDVFTMVRGFRADLYLDGLKLPKGNIDGTSSSVIDPWGLERLEVLKGPASGLYGASNPGGVINMVSKRPTDAPVRELQIKGGSFDRIQGAFDFGGPVDEEGKFLYRITGLARDAGSQIDHAEEDRVFIAPAVTWRPTDDTSLTLLGSYQRDRGVWPFFNYLPAEGSLYRANGRRISTDTYLGEPDFDRLKRDQSSIGYEFDHRFSETFSFKQNLRFSRSDFQTLGAVTGRASPNPDGTIDRLGIFVDADTDVFAVDNQLRAEFASGPLWHDAVMGVDYRREKTGYLFTFGAAPSIDPYDPVYGSGPISPRDFTVTDYQATLNQVGVYAQDRIRLGQWIATLGGRYDRADSDLDGAATAFGPASRLKRKDDAFTGRAGLTYLFENGIAPYVSYASSFQPETGVDTVAATPFKPSQGEQFEAGVKYQPPGMNALFTVAAFDLEQKNRVTTDQLFVQRQIGEVHIKGVEVEAKAEIAKDFNVIAAYSYLDHEITRSADPLEVGRKLFSTPNHQAALWGDYAFTSGALAGFGLGAGARYIGSTTDASNTLKTPAVTLFDGQVKLDLARFSPQLVGATLKVNATNIFDKKYVSQCDGSAMCTFGVRRTIIATLNYRW
ncbi:TonB-dependent siderophore receptor [Hansschlegelia quercus]|nr:TonB-dependent siderophore receptor [Hansschlegelia quercus]